MDGTGNASLLKTTKTSEWSFDYGGYLTVAFGGFILFGCLLAYIIAVARGNVEAFLPLISDAAGSPPQNGLFGTFLCLGGMFGVAFMLLRYMIVLEKNREKSNLVTNINKASLFFGITSMLGITLVTGYPINFYRNRDVWLTDVGLPHIIGGVMLFALGLVYIALQCVLTLFLKTKNQMTLVVRVALLFICTVAFVYHMITVPDNFGGISHKYYMNGTDTGELNTTGLFPYPSTMGADLKLPIDTSGNYVTSAITEWIFVIFFCCFFLTFFNEAQQYSLLVVVETHCNRESDPAEERKAEIRRLSIAVGNTADLVDTKPAPDMKKYLRRDSTCQTANNGVEKIIIPTKHKDATNGFTKTASKPVKKGQQKSAKIDISNGTKKILTNADIDAKLDKILQDIDESEQNGVPKEVKHTEMGTSCEDMPQQNEKKKDKDIDLEREAERIAIEKIDVVVKDAEESAKEILKNNHGDNGSVKKSDTSKEVLPSVCPYSIQ